MPTLVYTELHVYMRLPTHITGLWVTQLISRLISDDAHAYLMLALVPVVTVQNRSFVYPSTRFDQTQLLSTGSTVLVGMSEYLPNVDDAILPDAQNCVHQTDIYKLLSPMVM